jgi:hypothetical protein
MDEVILSMLRRIARESVLLSQWIKFNKGARVYDFNNHHQKFLLKFGCAKSLVLSDYVHPIHDHQIQVKGMKNCWNISQISVI